MARSNTGLPWRFSTSAYPQNVHISGYELQILKNIFVKDDYSYLTR